MKTGTGVEKTHFRFVFRVSELETRFLSGLSAMQKSAMEPKNHGSLAHRPLRRWIWVADHQLITCDALW